MRVGGGAVGSRCVCVYGWGGCEFQEKKSDEEKPSVGFGFMSNAVVAAAAAEAASVGDNAPTHSISITTLLTAPKGTVSPK